MDIDPSLCAERVGFNPADKTKSFGARLSARVKPDKQAKQEVLSKLSKLVETVFEAESEFAVIHGCADNSD
jgi:hypothetical protein